jgi:hypothetical protein
MDCRASGSAHENASARAGDQRPRSIRAGPYPGNLAETDHPRCIIRTTERNAEAHLLPCPVRRQTVRVLLRRPASAFHLNSLPLDARVDRHRSGDGENGVWSRPIGISLWYLWPCRMRGSGFPGFVLSVTQQVAGPCFLDHKSDARFEDFQRLLWIGRVDRIERVPQL